MKKLSYLFLFVVLAGWPLQSQAQAMRVKCGGSHPYTDSKGQVWEADTGYNEGNVTWSTNKIMGTPDPQLYETGRTNNSSKPLIYTLSVTNGMQHVNLYFAETSPMADYVGGRVFNVKMQGNMVFSGLDIFAAVGANAPLIQGVDVPVTSGKMTIELDSVVANAKINAIEIVPVTGKAPVLNLDFVYPDGTPVDGKLSYVISSSALSFRGSVPLSAGKAQCELLSSPSALGISTQFKVNLSLTDSAGHVAWQMTLELNPAEVNFGSVESSALKVVVDKQ